jgi:hypothetical protein
VQGAAQGESKAFSKALDLVYGRKGKVKWELMQPFLSCLHTPKPPRLISTVPKSRPPIFSNELKALLTSDYSRTTKPLSKSAIVWPHVLPARADPKSEDARLYGRLSKRRELKIRWRNFNTEWKKVLPPLQIRAENQGETELRTLHLMRDIEALAGLPQSTDCAASSRSPTITAPGQPFPCRWYRRRYKNLLGRIPILEKRKESDESAQQYVPNLSDAAVSSHVKWNYHGSSQADSEDIAWMQLRLPNLCKKSQIQQEIRATSRWLYENSRF